MYTRGSPDAAASLINVNFSSRVKRPPIGDLPDTE